MARMLRLSMGLLAVALISAFGLHPTTGQEATPPPFLYEIPQGLDVDALVRTPYMKFAADTTFGVRIDRYTYEPGVNFELVYAGPVLYYVEIGKLAVADIKGLMYSSIYEPGKPSPRAGPVKEGDRFVFLPGQSVFACNGKLGPTQNLGDQPLVVLALLLVPDQGGIACGVTGDPNATPMKGS